MLTRKTHIMLAKCVSETLTEHYTDMRTMETFVDNLMIELRRDNPRFARDRFTAACFDEYDKQNKGA